MHEAAARDMRVADREHGLRATCPRAARHRRDGGAASPISALSASMSAAASIRRGEHVGRDADFADHLGDEMNSTVWRRCPRHALAVEMRVRARARSQTWSSNALSRSRASLDLGERGGEALGIARGVRGGDRIDERRRLRRRFGIERVPALGRVGSGSAGREMLWRRPCGGSRRPAAIVARSRSHRARRRRAGSDACSPRAARGTRRRNPAANSDIIVVPAAARHLDRAVLRPGCARSAIITFCASSTSASFIGPRASISSRMPSAARLDMQPRKRLRMSSSTPFSARDQHVAVDVADQRAEILVVQLEQIVEDEHRLLDRLGDFAVDLGQLGHHALLGRPCAPLDRIFAASRVPPSCTPADAWRGWPARLASIVFSVSIASGVHRAELGDAAQDLRLHRLGQHARAPARPIVGIEIGEQHGGDLRMLLLDHRGDLGALEPVEQVDLARGLRRA